MSKHIGRNQRWTQRTPSEYVSTLGVVRYQNRAWFGLLSYHTADLVENQPPEWQSAALTLGPFKRPRNAMVALEREVTALRNRHGEGVRIGTELWGEGRRD